jgi:hypothetical protein
VDKRAREKGKLGRRCVVGHASGTWWVKFCVANGSAWPWKRKSKMGDRVLWAMRAVKFCVTNGRAWPRKRKSKMGDGVLWAMQAVHGGLSFAWGTGVRGRGRTRNVWGKREGCGADSNRNCLTSEELKAKRELIVSGDRRSRECDLAQKWVDSDRGRRDRGREKPLERKGRVVHVGASAREERGGKGEKTERGKGNMGGHEGKTWHKVHAGAITEAGELY